MESIRKKRKKKSGKVSKKPKTRGHAKSDTRDVNRSHKNIKPDAIDVKDHTNIKPDTIDVKDHKNIKPDARDVKDDNKSAKGNHLQVKDDNKSVKGDHVQVKDDDKSVKDEVIEINIQSQASPDRFKKPSLGECSPTDAQDLAILDNAIKAKDRHINLSYKGKHLTNLYSCSASQDCELFHHFFSHFIPYFSSNLCTIPDNLLINLKKFPALTELFLCFGAIYLSKISNPKYHDLANTKYSSALLIISNHFKNNNADFVHDWLYSTSLCLCLKNGVNDVNEKKCLQQSIIIYNLLIHKFKKIEFTMELSNSEKLFINSLTFGYTCALLSFNDSRLIKLPSSCDVFLKLRIAYPSINSHNHVSSYDYIFIIQIITVEIISKLIWMLRLHSQSMYESNQEHYIDDFHFWNLVSQVKPIFKLIDDSLSNTKSKLEKIKISNLSHYEHLRSRLAISVIINNSAKIVYEKATNPTLPAFVPKIQDPVNVILNELTNLINDFSTSSSCSSSCWIGLGLLIAGCSSINNFQRKLIISKLATSNDLGSTISSILQQAWSREYIDQTHGKLGDKGYKSFNLLFDRQSMEQLEL